MGVFGLCAIIISDMLIRIFLFFLGLCVGSFLNVIISWLEKKRKNIFGRSFCDYCQKKINWYDLIPVFSFLFLKGKCRYCRKKIKIEYFFVELATGILFSMQYAVFSMQGIFYLLIVSLLIILFVYDLKTYTIPDIIVFLGLGISLAYLIFNSYILHTTYYILPFFLAAVVASGFFAILVLLSHETWLGWGDVKLAILMGLLLGWPNILLALFASFLFGAIIGVSLILFKKKTLKSQIPFGPFLVGATIICLYLNLSHLLNFWSLWPLSA